MCIIAELCFIVYFCVHVGRSVLMHACAVSMLSVGSGRECDEKKKRTSAGGVVDEKSAYGERSEQKRAC